MAVVRPHAFSSTRCIFTNSVFVAVRLFIIEGGVTALVAGFGFFLLPDNPSETRWLTPEEKELCIARISRDTVGQQTRGTTWEGLKQACSDPRTWLFCLMQNLHLRCVNQAQVTHT